MKKRFGIITFIFFILIILLIPSDRLSAATNDSAAASAEKKGAAKKNPISLHASYRRHDGKATVTVTVEGENGPVSVKYLRGNYKSASKKWDTKAKNITKRKSFTVKKSGLYSILAEDSRGNREVCQLQVNTEFRAVWIAYYDFSDTAGSDEQTFRAAIDTMFDNAVNAGMNAVVVHVRPYGDAMYPSKYYPWSKYASGTQGVDPGYDPLGIMVEKAHERNLEIHAWLNPYRVTASTSDVSYLSEDNPARIWRTNKKKSDDRNVLTYYISSDKSQLLYNPSKAAVRELITNGVTEIVQNYDVDGIHFDDYFYPDWLGEWPNGEGYDKSFDYKEYEAYVARRKAAGKKYKTIEDWRRGNVNRLIKGIYTSIKEINPDVVFGISPGGFLDYLLEFNRYYVDFPTWMAETGYIDYICPQLYWSFNKTNLYPYDEALNRWLEYKTNSDVEFYCGLALYKCTKGNAGSSEAANWAKKGILKKMVNYGRTTGKVEGYVLFDYADLINPENAGYLKKLKEAW